MNTRININLHLSGTIAVADFARIASLIEPDNFNVAIDGSDSGNRTDAPANKPSPEREPDAPVAEQPAEAEAEQASDGALDAHGHPWSADLHASTKGVTKDGLWRMKVGVSRPEPMPGFPVAEATGTPAAGAASEAGASATTAPASSPAATIEEDDEFAAFRDAAAASDAKGAAATVPERKWTDTDLGSITNQAATKLGAESVPKIKALIAEYIPEGEVAHSRNIPEDRRADFAKALEALAGITFDG